MNHCMRSVLVGVGLCVVLCTQGLAGDKPGVRDPILAGAWYPSDAAKLRAMVQGFLAKAEKITARGKLVALIAPHAGYDYSGRVAGQAYKLLEKQRIDTVVVLAPSHRAPFAGVAVYDAGGFRTPLGVMELDNEFIATLKAKEPRVSFIEEAHRQEHAVEIQIPFLQVVQPNAKLVPLVVAEQNPELCQALAKALAQTIGESKNKSVLLVASSDLSHYHERQAAKALDDKVLESVKQFDPEMFLRNLVDKKCEACGAAPILTIMYAAKLLGATSGQVLAYGDSGDTAGDTSKVVGYLAAAFWQNGEKKPAATAQTIKQADAEKPLTTPERELLFRIAREAIGAALDKKQYTPPRPDSPRLTAPGAAFVTLKKDGQLRGCIGHIVARTPLYETVASMAQAAAFQDTRFSPLTKAEFKDISFEISALTPLKKITDVAEIEVGKHGILLRRGAASGLLLPQVATEYGWDRTAFLENTCRKAGLPREAWKEKDTEIFIFSAEVF